MGFQVANGDLLRHVIQCRLDNQIGLNVRWWVVQDVTDTAPDVTDVLADVSDDIHGLYKAWLGTTSSFQLTMCQRVQPTPTIVFTNIDNAGVGTAGINSQGAQVSGCVTLQSLAPGRSNRGRMYLPFPGADIADPPFGLTGAGTTAGQAIGDYFAARQTISTLGGAGSCVLKPVVVHVDWEPGLPTSYVVGPEIITARINDKLATQRRRGAYGRPNP